MSLRWNVEAQNMFQHDHLHSMSSMETCFAKIGVEKLECPAQGPDLNPSEHLWDDVELRMCLSAWSY